ncbi:MAG: molybdenum hydroxylase [bacterium]|jgi:xanthine dehydrogenase accessory factor
MDNWIKRPIPLALVIGGGELGSATAHRLARSGLGVVVVDIARPKCIRRKVCFAAAVLEGRTEVEGIKVRHVAGADDALRCLRSGEVPLFTQDYGRVCREMKPDIIVDARMTKTESDISSGLAPFVIGLGPGFEAGRNVDAVVETMRGHDLGRVIEEGCAAAFTGVPGEIGGLTSERVIRSPRAGILDSKAGIGDMVKQGDVVAVMRTGGRGAEGGRGRADGSGGPAGGDEVRAPISGLLRGLIADGSRVRKGQKIGDVDPRGRDVDPATISDKGRAVAGGVLEAIMHWWKGK